jgi:hypothetical protein
MSKEITGAPAYSTEFNSLMEKLKNREEAKKMSDQELHNLREAVYDEMIRREVVRHIQTLANQIK